MFVDEELSKIRRRLDAIDSKIEMQRHILAIVGAQLQAIRVGLKAVINLQEKESTEMSALDDAIAKLTTDVATLTTVDQSAVTLINGIQAQIQAAVNAALAAGATPAQLQALSDLTTTLETQDTNLAAAVAANTPVAPPPAPAPGP